MVEQAQGVADHAGQGDAAAVGQGTPDDEHDAGPGDRDQDQRGHAEGDDLVRGEHGLTLVAPASGARLPSTVTPLARPLHRASSWWAWASVLLGSVLAMTKTTATLTARSPEDVLAAVPLVLGFVPEESVVMLTFGAEHPFHARLDLPRSARERRAAAEALVDPAVRHGVRRVLFVLYAADAGAREVVRAGAGAGLRAAWRRGRRRAAQRRPLLVRRAARPDRLRVGRHALRRDRPPRSPLQSVAAGRVTQVLARRAGGDRRRRPVARRPPSRLRRRGSTPDAPPDRAWVRATGGPVGVPAVDPPDPATDRPAARGAARPSGEGRGPRRGRPRGGRPTAAALVVAWSGAAPTDLLAPVASVAGLPAWLAGDGALAWCALDRAAEGEPPCSLADVVAEALEQALPPCAVAPAVSATGAGQHPVGPCRGGLDPP